jgi:hypothetical protein
MYSLEYKIAFVRTFDGFDEATRELYVESFTKNLENMKRVAEEQGADTEKAMGFLFLSVEDFLAKPDLGDKE